MERRALCQYLSAVRSKAPYLSDFVEHCRTYTRIYLFTVLESVRFQFDLTTFRQVYALESGICCYERLSRTLLCICSPCSALIHNDALLSIQRRHGFRESYRPTC